MIEDIKKELLNCDVEILYGKFGEEYKYLKHSDVVKILEKYNNQDYLIIDKKMFKKMLDNQLSEDCEVDAEDYWLASIEDKANELERFKDAWEELLKQQKQNEINNVNVGSCLELMQELEKKHNLGVKE